MKRPSGQCGFIIILTWSLSLVMWSTARPAEGQALNTVTTRSGVEIIVVTQPLTDASAACWPVIDEGIGPFSIRCVQGSELTFLAMLERAFAETPAPADETPTAEEVQDAEGVQEMGAVQDVDVQQEGLREQPSPPVVVVVGGSSWKDVSNLCSRVLTRSPAQGADTLTERDWGFGEGGHERRLGAPGGDAGLRLEVPLPHPASSERTAVEALWSLLPQYLDQIHQVVQTRVNGDVGELEVTVDAELAGLELRRLRLAIAQLAGDPDIEEQDVERAAQAIRVNRLAVLESPAAGAELLVDRWLRGGAEAIREYLFAPSGLTGGQVRRAAASWLPRHPGRAVITLPPRVFRPRFAPGPSETHLDNDLAVAILERPAANLSAVVLRPVLLSGLRGEAEAVVLTRLAAVLRSRPDRPPHIKVQSDPPSLEIATSEDGFAALCESLQTGLEALYEDAREVTPGTDARSRAARLMAGVLGLDISRPVTPASMLSAGNLALGGVSADAETAIEALRKLGVGGAPSRQPPTGSQLSGGDRRRMPASGTASAVVVALPDAIPFPFVDVAAAIVERRAQQLLHDTAVEAIQPLIPGRRAVVMIFEKQGSMRDLEDLLEEEWPELTASAAEDELERAQRELAARLVVESNGVLGRARAAAAVAAGERVWRAPSEVEMLVLTASDEDINQALEKMSALEALERTASGPLEIVVSHDS